MGLSQTVAFSPGTVPSWESVHGLLAARGFPPQVRMIDGELAFPDEAPPAGWRELRVGTPQGMVTLRRAGDAVEVVTWGNADRAMLQAWNAVAWALAEAGGGIVQTAEGPKAAEPFRASADFPEVLRKPH
jgi:hypothetical protein